MDHLALTVLSIRLICRRLCCMGIEIGVPSEGAKIVSVINVAGILVGCISVEVIRVRIRIQRILTWKTNQ